jgi:DNA-binding SARP family transcriptional activator/tetratricopeptide (TPR) repeat protein
VQFRVLGPVEIVSDGQRLPLARRQERCLLAILLLDAGRVVSADRLCALLWDDNPPESARRILRSHVARIRAVLARGGVSAETLEWDRDGYLMRVDPDTVDAHRFRRLLEQGTASMNVADRQRILREALSLWRGPALQDAASDRLRQRICVDLDELHLHAIEESLAARLELGHERDLVPELTRLSDEHPLRERLVGLHMLALHHTGRTSHALDAYNRFRTRLADQLGLDPSPTLRELHTAILRGDPPPARTPTGTRVPPAQLPADLTAFTGRADDLRQLDTLLGDSGRGADGSAVVISAIAGTAGVGKTALAVHWAHRVRGRFPDGQLYVNLRGFDPRGAMSPEEAVRVFLDALVPPQRIPVGPDAQVGLYRSLLAGKRMLVVLDNAGTAEQVRPLLPGSAGCLTVVTSRRQLPGLVASEGAHALALDLLSFDEARELLARRLGQARVGAESAAVDEIIGSCARLPLPLAIVAARAITEPSTSLAELADQLRKAHGGLEPFTGDDRATDVRTVFSWSYRRLSPAAARLFRLVGWCAGPDITAAAAASLAGSALAEVGSLLAELTEANLLTEPVPGRHTLHDLLRAYATEQCEAIDSADDRSAALDRLLDHYLHSAHAADMLLAAAREDRFTLAPAGSGAVPEVFTNSGEAMAWFTAEHRVLVAAVLRAVDARSDRHAWQLACTLVVFLDLRGHWPDLVLTQRAALKAALRLGDAPVQARMRRDLARALSRQGHDREAEAHLREALDIYRELSDTVGQASTHHHLAVVLDHQGRHRDALDQTRRMFDLFRAAGIRRGEANALNLMGWYLSLLGDHRQALSLCQQALAILEEEGDRYGQAATWDSVGYAHHHLGDYPAAVASYQPALAIERELGYRQGEALSLAHLGDTHHAAGDDEAARTAWRQALAILDELAHPDADQVRVKLDQLDAGVPAGTAGPG